MSMTEPVRVRRSSMRLVSIVIPTLNEDLAPSLKMLGDNLRELRDWNFEIIVVDDSRDDGLIRSRAAAADAALPDNLSVQFLVGTREGKGAAVHKGIRASQGDFVFTVDVDFPAPLHCIGHFLQLLESGADVVIAERCLDRHFASAMRWLLSRGLLVVQRAVVFNSAQFRDTQCGFKAFRGDLVRDIAAQQIVKGGMYDLEYLYVAHIKRQRIEKVSITPAPELRSSRINVWKCLRQDPVDVLRVKTRGLLGKYH